MAYPTSFLGVPIDHFSPSDALDTIVDLVETGRIERRPAYVATANVDYFVQLYRWDGSLRCPELLEVLRRAHLVTADGMPLVWCSRLTGVAIKERMSGATLLPLLANLCARRGFTLFFLGGTAAIANRAIERLRQAYPGLKVVGMETPEISLKMEDQETQKTLDHRLLQTLALAKPDLLILNLGCPKQELWFHRVVERLQVPVSIGLGGTLKFLAGEVHRAPGWMQNAGLEWLYRWSQEPAALTSRYMRDLIEFPLLAASMVIDRCFHHQRSSIADPVEPLQVHDFACISGHYTVYQLPARITADFLETTRLPPLSTAATHPLIDFHRVEALDARALGFLFAIGRQHHVTKLLCTRMSPPIEKRLRQLWVTNYFQPFSPEAALDEKQKITE